MTETVRQSADLIAAAVLIGSATGALLRGLRNAVRGE